MPRKRVWLVLRDFTWSPKASVVMTFRQGETRAGLTRACREAAGDRIREIRDR